MKCWEHLRSSACRASVQQLVMKGCFCTEPERIWILVSTRSQTRGCIDHDLVTGRRETCCDAINTLGELSVTEQAIYMSGSGLLQYIALENGCGVCYERGEITNSESSCAGIAVVETCGKVFGWTSRDNDKLSVP